MNENINRCGQWHFEIETDVSTIWIIPSSVSFLLIETSTIHLVFTIEEKFCIEITQYTKEGDRNMPYFHIMTLSR